MNSLARHFLPSVMRGVYRYDGALSGSQTEEEFEHFVRTKLRFLPRNVPEEIQRRATTGNVFDAIARIHPLSRESQDASQRAKAFFRQHPYFGNALVDDKLATDAELKDATNYLEIQFVKKVLAPSLTEVGLLAVQPQRRIGPFSIDFALEGTTKIALEVDGFSKFESRRDLDSFTERQNFITREGWRVIRFTYGQIMDRTAITASEFQAILKGDAELGRFLNSKPQTSLFSQQESFGTDWPVVEVVNAFYQIQDCFVDYALSNDSERDGISIADGFEYEFPFVAAALSSLYEHLDGLAEIMDVDFQLPVVEVLGADFPASWEGRLHRNVQIGRIATSTAFRIDRDSVQERSAAVPQPPCNADEVEFRRGLSLEAIKNALQYVTKNIFGFPDGSKPFQDRVLQRVFNGRDVLGISATGSGKSFCFWLPALLKPGITFVVSPLRSLMRDQRLTLEGYGIASADFINSDVDPLTQRRILEEIKLGYVRLLYISPERLRIKTFVAELARLREVVPINFIVIDEAHCISEWGHDFRPSYLKIPFLRDAASQPRSCIPLIALTATAGPQVEKDILGILRLKEGELGDVAREKLSDRERFSYQVAAVSDNSNKAARFYSVLKDDLPRALEKKTIQTLLAATNKRGDKSLGIVFCIYADPHGKQTLTDGIAHYLFETMKLLEPTASHQVVRPGIKQFRLDAFSSGKVRAFSSKEPTLCPKCYSYAYSALSRAERDDADDVDDEERAPQNKAGLKKCADCAHEFAEDNAVKPPGWNELTKKNQTDFKKGTFDILVATKGFGMGIDKSSVRFVVHTSMSSGLESWYQEVGRAGRDNERAHVVLLVDPPNESCQNDLLEKFNKTGIARPECNFQSGCTFGKSGLCDYGKQHVFITGSYPGVERDAVGTLRVLAKIIQSSEEGGTDVVSITTSPAYMSRDELSIYRLSVLGLVRDYVVTYGGRQHFDVTVADIIQSRSGMDANQIEAEIARRLGEYFAHLKNKRDQSITQGITRCRQEYRSLESMKDWVAKSDAYIGHKGLFDVVYEHLLLLLDHAYRFVLQVRYEMLWNLLKLATSTDCRRAAILPRFGDEIEQGYKCGCCDICSPSLSFLDIRATPKTRPSDTEKEIALDRVLAEDAFDIPTLKGLSDAFREYPDSIYRRARSVLEGNPGSLPALFFTREFSPAAELEGNAKRLLRTANQRPVVLDDIKTLFVTSPGVFKPDLLLMLNESDTATDSIEGWEFLADEAAKPQHRRNPSVELMGEALEFLVAVHHITENETQRLQDKARKLEAVFNA